jgi:hypothetical protein
MDKLDLVDTDELLEELISRFDSCVFAGARHSYEGSNLDKYKTRFKGPISTIRGLIDILNDTAIDMTYELMEEEPEST